MIDIVFPNGNEKAFIDMAEKLGYKSICLVYPFNKFNKKKIPSHIDINYGVLCTSNQIRAAKRYSDIIFVKAGENARGVIESHKDIIVFDAEESQKRDFIHQRRSGLNHIMCNLATKNNIKIGLSFNSLLSANDKKRNILMGRISSNINLCRKYKTKVIIGSFASEPYEMRNYQDLLSTFKILGAHASEIKSI